MPLSQETVSCGRFKAKIFLKILTYSSTLRFFVKFFALNQLTSDCFTFIENVLTNNPSQETAASE